jgi:hypothetical protein
VRTRLPQAVAALVAGALTAAALAAPAAAAPKTGYTVTNLVSDMPGVAANTDPHLQNAWAWTKGRPRLGGSPTTRPTCPRSTTRAVRRSPPLLSRSL